MAFWKVQDIPYSPRGNFKNATYDEVLKILACYLWILFQLYPSKIWKAAKNAIFKFSEHALFISR